KWTCGSLSQAGESKTSTSTSSDEARMLPSRYYDTATEYGNAPRRASGQPLLRARFHGSSDARLSHSNYYSASICENGGKLATEPEREEVCEWQSFAMLSSGS
ncbi:hypothetical protein KIN20_007746, partial [Parelaphostrongylus tenuis]